MNKITSWFSNCTCTLGLLLTFSLPAFADQCAYITRKQAVNAISRLDLGQSIYFLCEPCGENIPQIAKITDLSMGTVGYEDFWQVNVNKKGIDLAYTFIDSGIENNLINLAAISNCPAELVSPTLLEDKLPDSKKAN